MADEKIIQDISERNIYAKFEDNRVEIATTTSEVFSFNRTTNSFVLNTFCFPCPLLSLRYVRYDNTAPSPVYQSSTSASRSAGWRRVLPWLTADYYTRRIDRSMWALDQSGRWSVNRKRRQYISFNNPSLNLAHAAAFCAGCTELHTLTQTILSSNHCFKQLFGYCFLWLGLCSFTVSCLPYSLFIYLVRCNGKTWGHNESSPSILWLLNV